MESCILFINYTAVSVSNNLNTYSSPSFIESTGICDDRYQITTGIRDTVVYQLWSQLLGVIWVINHAPRQLGKSHYSGSEQHFITSIHVPPCQHCRFGGALSAQFTITKLRTTQNLYLLAKMGLMGTLRLGKICMSHGIIDLLLNPVLLNLLTWD